MDNLLTFLGLMRRAGKLTAGAEASFDECRAGRARVIALAADAAPNTGAQAAFAAQEYQVPLVRLPFEKADVGQALGLRDCAVFTVCDTGFAIALCRRTGQTGPLEALERRLRREQKKGRARGHAQPSARRGSHR